MTTLPGQAFIESDIGSSIHDHIDNVVIIVIKVIIVIIIKVILDIIVTNVIQVSSLLEALQDSTHGGRLSST